MWSLASFHIKTVVVQQPSGRTLNHCTYGHNSASVFQTAQTLDQKGGARKYTRSFLGYSVVGSVDTMVVHMVWKRLPVALKYRIDVGAYNFF